MRGEGGQEEFSPCPAVFSLVRVRVASRQDPIGIDRLWRLRRRRSFHGAREYGGRYLVER